MHFRPITPQDRNKNIAIIAAFLALVLALVIATIVFQRAYLALTLIAFCLLSAVALTKWAVDTHGYECPSCQHQFEISMRMALLTPHMWDKKLLRCPSCGKTNWARAIIKVHSSV